MYSNSQPWNLLIPDLNYFFFRSLSPASARMINKGDLPSARVMINKLLETEGKDRRDAKDALNHLMKMLYYQRYWRGREKGGKQERGKGERRRKDKRDAKDALDHLMKILYGREGRREGRKEEKGEGRKRKRRKEKEGGREP